MFAFIYYVGTIPDGIGELAAISYLNIMGTSLKGNFLLIFNYFAAYYIDVIGRIPSTICQLSKLLSLVVTVNGGNSEITCAPQCLSSVPNLAVPTTICVYPSSQDNALCGLIAATNIQSKLNWSCTTDGFTSTSPTTWPGLMFNGNSVVSINLGSSKIMGMSLVN